jgi:DNA-binding response OmpR family regulator
MAKRQQIFAEFPDQRILFMSAYPAEVLAQRGLQDLRVLFLAKPYTRAELIAKVAEAMRRPPPSAAEKEESSVSLASPSAPRRGP